MPASGRFLLDTNIVIALFEGDEAVVANLDLASEVFVPAIALGESFFWPRSLAGPLRTRQRWVGSLPAARFYPAILKLPANTDG